MKKPTRFIILLSMLMAITTSVGCSDEKDEQPEASSNANDIIVGEWELVKKGVTPWNGPKTTLVFGNDDTFIYQREEQTTRGKYTIPSFDQKITDMGALVFKILFYTDGVEDSNLYFCHFWTDSLRITNPQEMGVVDNSHYYIKKSFEKVKQNN